jgi:hypothetical protein
MTKDEKLEATVVAWARDHVADIRRVALADDCELSAALLVAIDQYFGPDADWSRL